MISPVLMQEINRYVATTRTSSVLNSWLLPLPFPNGRLLIPLTLTSAAIPLFGTRQQLHMPGR